MMTLMATDDNEEKQLDNYYNYNDGYDDINKDNNESNIIQLLLVLTIIM